MRNELPITLSADRRNDQTRQAAAAVAGFRGGSFAWSKQQHLATLLVGLWPGLFREGSFAWSEQ